MVSGVMVSGAMVSGAMVSRHSRIESVPALKVRVDQAVARVGDDEEQQGGGKVAEGQAVDLVGERDPACGLCLVLLLHAKRPGCNWGWVRSGLG